MGGASLPAAVVLGDAGGADSSSELMLAAPRPDTAAPRLMQPHPPVVLLAAVRLWLRILQGHEILSMSSDWHVA